MKYLIIAMLLIAGCKTTPPVVTGPVITPPVIVVPPVVTPPPVVVPEVPKTDKLNLESLDYPWKKPVPAIVIDAYQGNGIDWNKMAADKRMVAVIHRSAHGMRKDTEYFNRKKIALERGYLWGAYHLGSRGNTIAQADLFISMANDKDTLMILDLEDHSNASMMSLDESVAFMNYVYEKTGKIPVVYANHSVTVAINSKLKSNALFKKSKLWYARFKGKVTDFPVGIWNNYFLWQFSSEINCTKTGTCLYNVPGTSSDMDVNVFYGSAAELKENWNNK